MSDPPAPRPMTPARLAATAVAAAVAFVVGFFAGFFLLLSVVGLEDLRGWQFELATVPAGALFAGSAAAAAAPGSWRSGVVVTALGAAAVTVVALRVLGGDFGVAISLGGVLVVSAATLVAAVTSPAR